MSSSSTISIFTERPVTERRPVSLVLSASLHCLVVGSLVFVVLYAPVVRDPVFSPQYTLRHLEMHAPVDDAKRAAAKVQYPGPRAEQKKNGGGGSKTAEEHAAMRLTANALQGPQTLVQPDQEHPVKLKHEMPVPTAVVWKAKKVPEVKITPPLPEPVKAAEVEPSIQAPNDESNLADLSVSATNLSAKRQILAASTTTPLTMHGPEQPQTPAPSITQTAEPPAPAAVISLSDVKMNEGTVVLPPANETVKQQSGGEAAPGTPGEASHKGNGNGSGQGNGSGSGVGEGESAKGGTGTKGSPGTGLGIGSAEGAGGKGSTQHLTLPKDGQFGVVIVGSSVQDKYPEIAGMWAGRLAYTVYLHVGTAKSWILQYSLPRVADAETGGGPSHMEAPWPYSIVRPNLEPGAINADSLVVHGFVNDQGRFEELNVVFPPEYPDTQFVLGALQQWQFRPAAQNEKKIRVEVLLIIPETY